MRGACLCGGPRASFKPLAPEEKRRKEEPQAELIGTGRLTGFNYSQ